jgi:hypothetical protein
MFNFNFFILKIFFLIFLEILVSCADKSNGGVLIDGNQGSENTTFSPINDIRSQVNVLVEKIPFTITALSENSSCTSITVSSSNQNLIPIENITLTGTAPNCLIELVPLSDIVDKTIISLSVLVGDLEKTESFEFITYNPWTEMSSLNAPSARSNHMAVWTGNGMVVWGGGTGLNTGAMYNPMLDEWTPMSTTSAPQGRYWSQMVYDGSLVYIIGGMNGPVDSGTKLSSCARFDPVLNSWLPMAELPQSRHLHTAVWTGSRIIVWGGRVTNSNVVTNTGVSYNPITDSWSAISTTGAPSARYDHEAVWVGDKMLVWGGTNGSGAVDNGALYDPSTDTWTSISLAGRPNGHFETQFIWTGEKAFIWGGSTWGGMGTGGRLYDPITDSWSSISSINAPVPNCRHSHSTVWTGTEVIVWGGVYSGVNNTGGRYNPNTDKWIPTTTFRAPTARSLHTAVWTGSEMILWGGNLNGAETNTGHIYEP